MSRHPTRVRQSSVRQFDSVKLGPDSRLPTIWFARDRDEWDVALSDGAVYRIFRDRDTGRLVH